MNESDRIALSRISSQEASPCATTDELQGLLLQVVFALLMVFMIAFFMFVGKTEKEREEQVMELNRQKLTLALEKLVDDGRIRYGLNALMTQGVDGKRTFDPSGHVRGGRLSLAPAVKKAFSEGSKAAAQDFRDRASLVLSWQDEALSVAGVAREELKEDEVEWFGREVTSAVESLRLDVRGVQRSLAARLQKQWIENPKSLSSLKYADKGDVASFASEIEIELKNKSLELISKEIGSEVLP